MKKINYELSIVVSKQDMLYISCLNQEQKYAYDYILDKVFNNEIAAFFINGSGRTRKTYLYRVILATVYLKI